MGFFGILNEFCGLFVLVTEVSSQDQMLIFSQKSIQSLLRVFNCHIFWHFPDKLAFCHKVFAYIQASNDFAVDMYLRIRGPSRVISKPVSHVLIS